MRSNDYYDEEDIGPRRVSSMSREGPQEDLSLDPAPREAPVKKYPLCIILFLFLVVVTFVIVVVVATISTNHNSYNSAGIPTGAPATTIPSDEDLVIATTPNGTLGAIWKRGVLRCAVRYEVGRSQWNETRQQYDGFSVDLCRAISAAIFGLEQVEIKIVQAANRFLTLQSGAVDVLASWDTHTMERDLHERTTGAGFSFSIPYFYDGMVYAGRVPQASCLDGNDASLCRGVRVCVTRATTYIPVIESMLPNPIIVTADNMEGVYNGFMTDACDVMAGNQFDLMESVIRSKGYEGEYYVGSNIQSRDPLSLVTRDDDPVWSDFVNWIVEALITASERDFTLLSSLHSFEKTPLFGREFSDMFVRALGSTGSYQELYDRHFTSLLPRSTLNDINAGGLPLLYSMPFGNTAVMGRAPQPGSMLATIVDRGYLRCGISLRAIFAINVTNEWYGFDVDYCRALAAAIFGDPTKVTFTDLPASIRFIALNDGEVDVLSRLTTVTFARDVREPITGVGYSFARPNFYDGLSFGGVPPFATCADNLDWESEKCQDLRVCVSEGTTFFRIMNRLFPGRVVVPKATGALVAEGLALGDCNAISGGVMDVSRSNIRNVGGYTGDYETGKNRFSKDPLALVTRQDDIQWSTFVYWIVMAIVYAEEQDITSETAEKMPLLSLFGSDFVECLRNTIRGVGSYKEIYERNVEAEVARSNPNFLNRFPYGPQHFALPGLS